MESLTKYRPDKRMLEQMTAKFFAPSVLVSIRELTEGYFNAAYKVCLSDGRKVVLKIAPPKETRIMTYEKNIMRSEVEAMKIVENVQGILAPKVLGFDDSCKICKSPYFFMEMLPGESLSMRNDTLTKEQLKKIYLETGRIIRKVNEISGICFGYPGQKEFQGKAWYPVFQKMLKAGIQDAICGHVDLKVSVEELLQMLKRDQSVFAEVTEPHLVHWDCWDGNIFIEDGTVTGIIDWERCLWADPLMEVNFRTYEDNTWFRKGYGMEQFTDREYRRALWYDVYLMLLVSLECEYRRYATTDMYQWSVGILQEQFYKLANAVVL